MSHRVAGLTFVWAEGLAVGAGGGVPGHVVRSEQVAGVEGARLQLARQFGVILRKRAIYVIPRAHVKHSD